MYLKKEMAALNMKYDSMWIAFYRLNPKESVNFKLMESFPSFIPKF